MRDTSPDLVREAKGVAGTAASPVVAAGGERSG